jgi:TolA-binding protein
MSCERMTSRVVRWRELSESERTHALGCGDCRRALDSLESAIARAAADHTGPIDPSRSERLRMRLLDAARRTEPAPPSRAPRMALAVVVAGVVAAAALAFFHAAEPTTALTTAHGAVRASTGAHFTVLSDAPDEIVRLVDGTISVAVAPLAPGARFRVVVGDAEVEVRGTAFDVTAERDRLASVDVLHGRVEVRVDARPAIVLDAGQRWTPSAEPATVPPTAVEPESALEEARDVVPAAAHVDPPRASAPPRPWTPATGFEDGWTALHAGDAASAAAAFAEVTDRAPTDPLAEDAAFWRCVALSRTGDTRGAETALDAFVAHYPASARAGEASVMLGWLLVGHGEVTRARPLFERAAHDPSERIRASAERGLARIDAR